VTNSQSEAKRRWGSGHGILGDALPSLALSSKGFSEKERKVRNKESMKSVIHFDGGCSPNPGAKYGSYSIQLGEFYIERVRFDLGHGTNNEAEFESLLMALKELSKAAFKANVPHDTMSVSIFTDSTIVRNWLQRFERFNPSKCKNERRLAMSKLAAQCVEMLKYFQSFSIEWNSRDVNVQKFGH
jgi:ribonuclease HI